MLYKLFHSKTGLYPSKETRGKEPEVPGRKSYPRFPRTFLPAPMEVSARLSDTLSERVSADGFEGLTSPSVSELSALLTLSARDRTDNLPGGPTRRPYPSGGGLFPIETYIACASEATGEGGLFHYDPQTHALERLFPRDDASMQFTHLRESFVDERAVYAPMFILFSAVWNRTTRIYGDFGYRLILLEAGHIAQNILLSATALGLHARPIAGLDEGAAGEVLGLDKSETVLYAIALGKKSCVQT